MLINRNIIENLIEDAGSARAEKARKYKAQKKVKILKYEYENPLNFEVKGEVEGNDIYDTYVLVKNGEIEDISCTCPDYYNHYGTCKHSLATILKFADYNEIEDEDEEDLDIGLGYFSHSNNFDKNYRSFKQMVNIFYNEELEGIEEEKELNIKGDVKLEPQIFYDRFTGDLKVEFKIGTKKMYKIKNLSEFYTRMLQKELYSYGQKLKFVHTKESFEEEARPLLDFLMKYAEIIKYANSNSNSNYRFYGNALSETSIILGNSGIDELFEILKGKKVDFKKDTISTKIEFTQEEPNLQFELKKIADKQYEIVPNVEIYKLSILQGKEYKYILTNDKLYRCTQEFEKTKLKLLELFRQNYMTEVKLGEQELSELFSVVMPKVKNAITIENIPEKEIEKYKPKTLVVKVYLDFDKKNYLIADVKFCYENEEFNPLDEKANIQIPRNKIEETKALNIFRKTGFMLDIKNLRFILPNDDKIYEFMSNDINYYMQKFEVMVTENFKQKQIRQPKIGNLGVKIENNLLSINLENLEIDVKELTKVMQKYELKKK